MSLVHQKLPGFVAAQPGNRDLLLVRTDSTPQPNPEDGKSLKRRDLVLRLRHGREVPCSGVLLVDVFSAWGDWFLGSWIFAARLDFPRNSL